MRIAELHTTIRILLHWSPGLFNRGPVSMSTVLLRAAETGRIAKLPTVHASHAEVSAVFDNDLATPIVTAQADGQNHEPAGSVIDRQDLAFGVRLIY